MSSNISKPKSIGFMRILLMVVTIVAAVISVRFMYKYAAELQHDVTLDTKLIQDIWDIKIARLLDGVPKSELLTKYSDNLWTLFLAMLSLKLDMHPFQLVYAFFPHLFVMAIIPIYIWLGITLFKVEGKGRIFTYTGTAILLGLMPIVCYFGKFSGLAAEGGAYLAPWKCDVVVTMLIVPVIMATVSRIVRNIFRSRKVEDSIAIEDEGEEDKEEKDKKEKDKEKEDKKLEDNKKVIKSLGEREYRYSWWRIIRDAILLICEIAGVLVLCGISNWNSILSDGKSFGELYKEYFEVNWMLVYALVLLALMIGMKKKSSIAVGFTLIICVALMVPIPVGLVFAYATALLVIDARKYGLWQIVSLCCIIGTCIGMGIFEESSVNLISEAKTPVNDYRVPQSEVDFCEYMGFGEVTMGTTQDLADFYKCYYGKFDGYIFNWDDESNINTMLDNAKKSTEYIVHWNLDIDDETLLNKEYSRLKKLGEIDIYQRTRWEYIDDKWKHVGADGEYLTSCWAHIDERYYYFNADGYASTGFVEIDGNTYYFDERGEMLTEWTEVDGKWYYLGLDGIMLHDVTVDGYHLGSDGAWDGK